MKYNQTHKNRKFLSLLSLAVLVAGSILPMLPQGEARAAQITNRSLTLLPGTTPSNVNGDDWDDGGSMPGGTANHLFGFTSGESDTSVGSVMFEYCTTATEVPGGIDCNVPTGMDASGAAMGAEGGINGFSVSSASPNVVVLSRTSAQAVTASTPLTFRLDDIVNPGDHLTDPNVNFFVRITTHTSLDGSGGVEDSGNVAASTAEPIILSGDMPESLVFCTGATVSTTGGVPDCTTASDGAVAFDQLFSPTDTATATSQMAASTNAGAGYAITVNGETMTSGSNEIDPMSDGSGGPTSIVLGTSQFGLNLVENTATTDVDDIPLGLDTAPVPNGTNYRGQPAADYGTDDMFEYTDGDVVAQSDNGGAGGTDSQIFTSSYIVNVPGSQPAGEYTTTLTYICTATF